MVSSKKDVPTHGFGLVELIISLSIITIVTSVVLARNTAFNSAILLRNQAYEVAFVIRQAQQLAVSGQGGDLSAVQKQRYAVAFATASSGVVNRQTLLLYKDNNNNGVYDSSVDDLIDTIRLDSRFRISSLNTNGTNRGSIRVLFERPLFDAKFYQGTSNSLITGTATISIQRVGDTSATRTIEVTSLGQVTVK